MINRGEKHMLKIQIDPESFRKKLKYLIDHFEEELTGKDLRRKVLSLVPIFHNLRELGKSLVSKENASSARDRILYYYRHIPDPIRGAVLKRDKYRCNQCGWSHNDWNRSDPRHLELHHKKEHAQGGENTEENLITVCTVCHDDIHRKRKQ